MGISLRAWLVGLSCITGLALGCGDDSANPPNGNDAGELADGEPDGGAGGTRAGDAGATPDEADSGDGEPDGSAEPVVLSKDTSGTFLALTYNVAGLPEGLSSSMPERFTPLIGPLLNGYDLVLVQESWLTPDPNPGEPMRVYHELLMESAKHPFASVPAAVPWGMDERRPSALLGDGLNRFSNYPFDPVVRVAWDMCVDTSADCLALKGFSMARTHLAEGVSVDIYNLHMEAGSSDEDVVSRAAGIAQVVAFMEEMSAGRAVIIGGDFNLHTDSEPAAGQYAGLLTDLELTDACQALDCPDTDSIDKFAYRSGESVELDTLRWSDESEIFVSDMDEPLSDHPPIAVEFSWSKR